ncbi:hypothetical protein FOA52_014559 [Chlamydomonas sp. UWO 241]|nr:hypothetical protein FOA52_014559 [Chlamydomonas sp. UWO 241]
MDCSVCLHLLLDPVTAPCGHDLCAHCYKRWLMTSPSPSCPTCRFPLPATLRIAYRLARTIASIFPEEIARRRAEVQADEDQAAQDAAAVASETAPSSDAWGSMAGDEAPAPLPTYAQGLPYAGMAAQQCWAAAMPYMMMAASLSATFHAAPGQQCSGGCPPAAAAWPYAMHNAPAAQQHVAAPSDSEAAAEASDAGAQHPSPAPQQLRAAWQSEDDGPARLAQAHCIIEVLRGRGLQHALGAKFADAVRLLELMVYRAAPSRAAYLDAATLEGRIVKAHTTAAPQALAPPADAACMNGASVTLYERDPVFGGHTLTDTTSEYPVDLGFQVYNLTTYPNLVGFFDALGVDTQPSDMSFALSMDGGKLEWGSDNLDTVFAQRSNMASPSFLGMLRDVIRFGKEAPKVLEPANAHVYRDMSLGEYLKSKKYSRCFTYNYVVPMCAAVWSVPNANVLTFPVTMLVRFWANHHLLDVFQRPLWRVVKGRSRTYVKKVVDELPDCRAGCPVASVVRPKAGESGRAKVTTEAGDTDEFDAVVLATHSDVSMRLLGDDIDREEADVLGAIPYNDNDVLLHTDASLMPVNRKTWSSWNLIGRSDAADTSAVCVTYWINRLQDLPPGAPDMFVTLNPLHAPAADKVIRTLTLSHPVFSFESVGAQARVAELQGRRSTFFAGAWCGYGFHEDGIKAAIAATTAMGCVIPWVPRSVSPKSTIMQQVYLSAFDRFASATFKRGYLRIILPSGSELTYGSPDGCAVLGAKGEEWRGRPAPRATLHVFNFDFFKKAVTRHDTGLGEAYMERDFETNELGGLMAVLLANVEQTEINRSKLGVLNWLGDKLLWLAHQRRPNTIEGSRKNIEEHYDAGNDMYKLFLDESMMYSSAIHREGETMYQSQMNKLDAIIEQAGIQASDHVLEIGCGWGGFAIRAAQTTGCRVTGLTISKEQLAEATARVKAAGLEDRVHLMFCDYRDCPGEGTYDKVVSIEMIEAVGHEHLVPYFCVIGRMLKAGGKAVLQAISVPDERYQAYCNCGDFIREHIFPGGHLPCIGAMVEAARGTGWVRSLISSVC